MKILSLPRLTKHQKLYTAIFRNELATQAIKYLAVGGFCTVLDFGFLYLLVHYLHVHYLVASIISFTIGSIVNYGLCTYWIFSVRVVEKRHVELFYYTIITAVGLAINSGLIWLFTSYLGYYFMLSKLLATFITLFWNFGARKYFLHTKARTV